MATGVIAVGAHFEGLDWLDDGLSVVAALAYLVIAVLTALRTARYPRRVLADMTSHAHGFAFLTAVAATNVPGIAAGIIQGWWGFVWALWFVGIALCVVLLSTSHSSPSCSAAPTRPRSGINGTSFGRPRQAAR
jgi:tellurite resistance protein TehA-like permease